MMVGELLRRRFEESRDDVLLVTQERQSLTYGQALSNARRLATEWTAQGAERGDAIALVLANDVSFPCCYLACLLGGFIAVPINPELGEETVAFILSMAAPTVTLRSPPPINHQCAPLDDCEFAIDASSCGAVFFTSGTTGKPKGVRHSWLTLMGNVAAFNRLMRIQRQTRMYHVLPMAYMAGFLNTILSPLVAGGTVILGPRFSPATALDFWAQPAREAANAIWITPSIAAAIARLTRDQHAARRAAGGFDSVLCGTAPLPSGIRRTFLEQFGVPLQESYGTSELLLISAQSRAQAELMGADAGTPLAELEIAFRRDSEGRDEIMVRSPFALLDYLTQDGPASAHVSDDGFMPTGDVGKLDKGVLQITGRIKDIIIRGGINISPRTVEDALGDVPGVEDVAVIGVPHEFWGEKLVACIETAPQADKEKVEAAVRQRCRERLARSHQPDHIAVLAMFPRAVTGKVQKHVLQQSFAE